MITDMQFDNFDPTRPESSEVKPPFKYIEFNWHNGFAVAEKTAGAKHFGGWQISEENAINALANFGKVYPYFGESSMWAKGKGDGEYPARSSRFVTCAPIATRSKWYEGRDGNRGSTKYQFLVYLAEINKEHVITPYAPALINGGSYYSGLAISEAFQAGGNFINSNRSDDINGIPAWAFWGYYGTFGDKRLTREVGKTEKNTIAPCQFNASKPENLKHLYVGNDIAREIMSLRKQAQAWLDDAKSKKQEPRQSQVEQQLPPEEEIPY